MGAVAGCTGRLAAGLGQHQVLHQQLGQDLGRHVGIQVDAGQALPSLRCRPGPATAAPTQAAWRGFRTGFAGLGHAALGS
jgi:hypothetical protein